VDWAALARLRGTICILMGLTHLPAIVAELLGHGRPAQTPAAIVRSGTTGEQQAVRSDLAGIATAAQQAGIRPPAVVVIGNVVDVLGAAAISGRA
jgi:uroporphyrin-III C-methyltransferase/precorrin-2 dehydrogenase/sirohydrochlorin ferrochelatase